MSAAMVVGDWLLTVGCFLASGLQLAALRSPDVRESEMACALRRIKVLAWALLGARLAWLLHVTGDLPISFLSLAPLLLLAYADAAWALLRLVEHDSTDPRTTAPGELDPVPHHHWPAIFGRGKDPS